MTFKIVWHEILAIQNKNNRCRQPVVVGLIFMQLCSMFIKKIVPKNAQNIENRSIWGPWCTRLFTKGSLISGK